MTTKLETRVLIVGAGPTGLTLACELARRGVAFRLIEAAAQPFVGSRGKGLQPRTLEVFDDLALTPPVLAHGGPYPAFRVHAARLSLPFGRMNKLRAPTPDVPYPNLWMLPQWRTEELLRARLSELGAAVEFGTALTRFEQGEGGVSAQLTRVGDIENVRCEFLVGCDGAHSLVRKQLGVRFQGEALDAKPVVVADVELDGLDHESWHVWPLARGCLLTLCPLPGTHTHQLAAPLRGNAEAPELSELGMQRFIAAAIGGKRIRVKRCGWVSLYRPQVRMVDRYRVGRVLLAGDAAHVHPPAGGQGLNTGIQDAYNLGWKLAATLDGAPASLLDSYQAERWPVAAAVLGLSKRLQLSGSPRRGRDTQQLDLSYREGPLAACAPTRHGKLRAGDRAPDAPLTGSRGESQRLFDAFRGPHWTLLAFGKTDQAQLERTACAWANQLRILTIANAADAAQPNAWSDTAGHARAAYGVTAPALVLVRPDGHVGTFADATALNELEQYRLQVLGNATQ